MAAAAAAAAAATIENHPCLCGYISKLIE